MTVQEVFLADYEEIIDKYWALELMISNYNNHYYSPIEYADPSHRTCVVCNTPNPTTECGAIPRECCNSRCQMVREFWGVGGNINHRLFFSRTNKNKARIPYLKSRAKKYLGSEVALGYISYWSYSDRLFDLLITVMLERLAHENQSNHRRVKKHAV